MSNRITKKVINLTQENSSKYSANLQVINGSNQDFQNQLNRSLYTQVAFTVSGFKSPHNAVSLVTCDRVWLTLATKLVAGKSYM